MKRIIFNFTIAALLILFSVSMAMQSGSGNFNSDEVKNITEFLSSTDFDGRLAGTLENSEAASYIKTWFIQHKLSPYKGSYYDSFEVIYPKKLPYSPYLRVVDHAGSIKHEFQYGIDYKEDMLNFKRNHVKFNKAGSKVLENKLIQAYDGSDTFVFYLSDEKDMKFRSSFFSDSSVSMCIFISQNTLKSLSNYLNQGLYIECSIPYEQQEISINNVLGVIEGRHKDAAPIILSAHFDHVGSDLSGNVYSGALDNASGTAFMMEMAKYFKSLGKPERSILFIGFNAEEFGCLGSKSFVEENKASITGSKVFNFDMIGSDYGVPLCIMGSEADSANTELIKYTAAVCSSKKIYYNYLFKDASDHEYFRKNGIDAITFCDNDMSKIHTPLDTSNYISVNAIDRCFNVVSKEVIKYAYGNNILILYSRETSICSLAAILCLTLFSYIYSKIKRRTSKA